MTQFKHKKWGDIVTVEGNKVIDMPIRFLTDEWEEYEEPKGVYFISSQGDVLFWDSTSFAFPDDWTKEIEIGNYFSSREEAEKAVRKLKAWKRLKDKGFKFEGWQDLEACDETEKLVANRIVDGENIVGFKMDDYHDCIQDLNTCFGGGNE